jgi:hypothetical protein
LVFKGADASAASCSLRSIKLPVAVFMCWAIAAQVRPSSCSMYNCFLHPCSCCYATALLLPAYRLRRARSQELRLALLPKQ